MSVNATKEAVFRAKTTICQSLTQVEAVLLAEFFELKEQLIKALTPGLEAYQVWKHVENRNRMGDMVQALETIGRQDLAEQFRPVYVAADAAGVADVQIEIVEGTGAIRVRANGSPWRQLPAEPMAIEPPPTRRMAAMKRWQNSQPWKVVHSVSEQIYWVYRSIYEELIDCERERNDAGREAIGATLPDMLSRVDVQMMRLAHQVCVPIQETTEVRILQELPFFHPAVQTAIECSTLQSELFSSTLRLIRQMRNVSFRILNRADCMLTHFLEKAESWPR